MIKTQFSTLAASKELFIDFKCNAIKLKEITFEKLYMQFSRSEYFILIETRRQLTRREMNQTAPSKCKFKWKSVALQKRHENRALVQMYNGFIGMIYKPKSSGILLNFLSSRHETLMWMNCAILLRKIALKKSKYADIIVFLIIGSNHMVISLFITGAIESHQKASIKIRTKTNKRISFE